MVKAIARARRGFRALEGGPAEQRDALAVSGAGPRVGGGCAARLSHPEEPASALPLYLPPEGQVVTRRLLFATLPAHLRSVAGRGLKTCAATTNRSYGSCWSPWTIAVVTIASQLQSRPSACV